MGLTDTLSAIYSILIWPFWTTQLQRIATTLTDTFSAICPLLIRSFLTTRLQRIATTLTNLSVVYYVLLWSFWTMRLTQYIQHILTVLTDVLLTFNPSQAPGSSMMQFLTAT